MSTNVELRDVEVTRSETFLAFVLAVFLLIGGLWAYAQPLDRTDDDEQAAFVEPPVRAADRAALDRHEAARRDARRAERAEDSRREDLELAREDYRTALDAGRPAEGLERRYRRAQSGFERATRLARDARSRERELAPAAEAADRRIAQAQERADRQAEDRRKSRERETFGLRLAWVVVVLLAAFWFFNRLRRARSRYLVLGMAAIAFATAQAFVMAGDYTTDYIDVTEVGPLVLSLVGIALTVAAFVALQRYLARRLPRRRVRRGECPFCGHPVRDGDHCEGCGRQVVAECTTCGNPRRVGTSHCAACGNA